MKPRATTGPRRSPSFAPVVAALLASAAAPPPAHAQDEPDPPPFSTRVGGRLERIVVAPDGDLVVAGWAWDTDLSLANLEPSVLSHVGLTGHFLVARLARDGRPEWTAFVPGLQRDWVPIVRGLAVGDDGSVWVAGYGAVGDIPELLRPSADEDDGVVLKLSADGALVFATHVGGSRRDRIADLAVLPGGDAVVVGTTRSWDFLPPPSVVDEVQWREDAFVARIRADGSDLVWGKRYGSLAGGREFLGAALAVDPGDGTIHASFTAEPLPTFEPVGGLRTLPGEDPSSQVYRSREAAVVRLDASGEWQSGTRFRFPVSRGSWDENDLRRLPLALDADGTLLLGMPTRVVRLPAHLAWVEDASRPDERDPLAARLCPRPGGGVLVAKLARDTLAFSYLDADLSKPQRGDAAGRAPVVALGFTPSDVALDADGVVHVVGTGPGVSFHAPGETPGPTGGFVARVPLGGGRPPSELRARAISVGGAALRWSADGDGAERLEIERVVQDAAPEVVGRAPRHATSLRVGGLPPGSHQELRVVAVFADGRRAAGPLREVVTPPDPPAWVVATNGAANSVAVAWDDPNGDAAQYQVQRRIGGGPWRATRLVPWAYSFRPRPSLDADANPHIDLVADIDAPVRWRVRAVQQRRRTRWVESPDLLPAPALRVVPKSGEFGNVGYAPTKFFASGTLAARDGATPLAFHPGMEDLRLLFGGVEAPFELVVPAGDPGWVPPVGGVHRWNAAATLTGWDPSSEVVLDLARGTFEVSLWWPYARPGAASGSVVFNLSLGGRSGGHVRTWRRSSLTPTLVRLGTTKRRGGQR